MAQPYYNDGQVVLWHGDCREITEWLGADVLVTDPPYGIGWRRGHNRARNSRPHAGIANDHDTSARDAALNAWGERPALVFGSFYAPPPAYRQVLVWRKPGDAGVVGSTCGWRRDVEPVYLMGAWPKRPVLWSSLLYSRTAMIGGASGPGGRYDHPHAKPVDLMTQLIDACPLGAIADPFAGSGSTLVAAKQLGREAIGVELEERYCEMAARRLSQGVLPMTAEATQPPQPSPVRGGQ